MNEKLTDKTQANLAFTDASRAVIAVTVHTDTLRDCLATGMHT